MSSNENNNRPTPAKKYKTYTEVFTNSIPLSTLYRWQKKNCQHAESYDGDRVTQDCTRVVVDPPEISTAGTEMDSYMEDASDSSDYDTRTESECSIHSVNDDEAHIHDNSDSASIENENITIDQSDCEIDLDNDNYRDTEMCIGNIYPINIGTDSRNDDKNNFREMKKLYENSEITVDESVFNLLNFYIKNNITKTALQQSLEMQIKILPKINNMPKTMFHLLQYVKKSAPPCKIIRHYYCKQCILYSGNNLKNLRCPLCYTTNIKNMSFFIEFDIVDQIKFMFENQKLAEKMQPPREVSNNNIISDITDSSEYIRVNSRADRTKYDLTLILNTDGLSLVKSSKSHCWPLMFSIAELPVHLRESYVIMLGLWYDDTCKPPMNVFLEPFCLKLKECYEKGINWFHAPSKENVNTKVVAPLIVADAPARAEILNTKYFNSRYGCNVCQIQTEECDKVQGQKTYYVYKFKSNVKLRTEKRMLTQAESLRRTKNEHCKGIKGFSVISCLPMLNISTCVVPEFMHSVLLGVVKQMIKLWLEKKGPWNINSSIIDIDNYIASIRPPHTFSRLPRPLSQNKFYKALEFYNFMLFYSLPVLIDYLPTEYFQHWIIFVTAIFNLLKQNISKTDLDKSEELLILFVKEMETHYSDRELTYNVHQLTHLVLCVRRWGPLWATSAFPFENYNGYIAKSVHGNKNFGQEIVNNINIARGVQVLRNRINEQKSYMITNSQSSQFEVMSKICLNVNNDLNDEELRLLMSKGINVKDLQFYSRARINDEMFTSELYKDTKTNSHTVEINTDDSINIYGSIRYFFRWEDRIFLLCRRLESQNMKMIFHLKTKTVVQHIIPIESTEKFIIFQLNNIKCMTHLIKVGMYICKVPNNIKRVW